MKSSIFDTVLLNIDKYFNAFKILPKCEARERLEALNNKMHLLELQNSCLTKEQTERLLPYYVKVNTFRHNL